MLITYEREKITEFIGSQEAKINFFQKYNRIAFFDKTFSQFFAAGVYQLEDGPPIIVLPWFLKKSDGILSDPKIAKNDYIFFDVIREIKNFTDSAIDLSKDPSKSTALDIVVHSYLIKLKNVVIDLMSTNYHQDVAEKTNVIKGRWDIPKDLNYGIRPILFTCTYNSLEVNTPLFLFIKAFCKFLSSLLRSRKNRGLIDEVLGMLRDVDSIQLTRKTVEEAYGWIKTRKGVENLIPIVEFAEGLILDQTVYTKGAGVSYHFQMDKFFEELVFNFLKLKQDLVVLPQTREDLLGGAVWKSTEDVQDSESYSKKARQYTVPDIIAFDASKYLIFECKYKPLRIPFINSEEANPDLSSFSRDDRNQLLSFIMSIRPSPELRNKKIEFILIFPCNSVENYKISELNFESAKLHVDPIVRNLIQNRIKAENGSSLSIKFFGIDISYMIEKIFEKNSSAVDQAISLIIGNVNQPAEAVTESRFERVVQKRVALTSVIINKSKNDPTLGRVKLAKVFYLADAHLKLGMEAQYYRESAGPLDSRLLYNEKWGIESRGSKYSYYRRVDNRQGNRYIPGSNINDILERANTLFVDKIDNINWLIALLGPLNTEQAEIVTTLYACWNDLLTRKSEVSDLEIVSDFQNNWHESKKRFGQDQLLRAVKWMKDKNLVPDGSGPITATKIDKTGSEF